MTFPPKVIGLTTSCGACPNYQYYSGGRHQCALVGEIVRDKSAVAPFCPLPDFPSHALAQMEQTIRSLRDPYANAFGLTLMTHVAAKLKLNLNPDGMSLTIPFKDGAKSRQVEFCFAEVRELKVFPFELVFERGEEVFRLLPDENSPALYLSDSAGNTWTKHSLDQ